MLCVELDYEVADKLLSLRVTDYLPPCGEGIDAFIMALAELVHNVRNDGHRIALVPASEEPFLEFAKLDFTSQEKLIFDDITVIGLAPLLPR